MKKFMTLVLVLAMVFTMTACSNGGDSEGSTNGEEVAGKNTYFVCPKNVGGDYWTMVEQGVMAAAEELGDNVKVVFNGPAEVDSAKQINMIDDMIAQNVTAIATAPNDANAVGNVFKKAQDQGIDVITFDSDAPDTSRSWYVGPASDEYYGEQLGLLIGEMMDGEGELAFMCAGLGAENQIKKMDAAKAVLEEKYPNITVVTTVASDDDSQKALVNAQNLIKTYPNLKGILGFAGAEPPAAAEAVEQAVSNGELEEGQIVITGITFPNQCRDYVHSGTLKKVLGWNPELMGNITVKVLDMMANGVEINADTKIKGAEDLKVEGQNIYFGVMEFNEDNIDDYQF